MASQQSTIDFILEQIAAAGIITAKKMFGEYGVYCNGKIVAFVCDDQLFVKPTMAGKAFIGEYVEAYPYPGAKPYLLITGDKWDDHEWLTHLIRLTAAQLPLPKKK
jgi:TfoX/Sxy family transcriptional regulator of competence genes